MSVLSCDGISEVRNPATGVQLDLWNSLELWLEEWTPVL